MLGNDLLKGDLVYLNAITRDDVTQYAKWFGDLELLQYLWMQPLYPLTFEDEMEWYEQMRKNGSYNFAIRTLDHIILIGSAGLKTPDWKNRSAELGISIGNSSYWGRGYGTDATRVLLRYGFLELNLNRIELVVYGYNERAIKSYQKIGFRHEGTRRQALFREGRYYDTHLMAMLRQEWQDSPNAE